MLKINDKVKFHYLKQFKDELKSGQVLTDYTTTSESYSGKVVDVRNIIDQPVSNETIRRNNICLLYTSPSPRDKRQSRMPSSA